MFEYIKEYYGVNVELNMAIEFDGDKGIITKDNGNYIGVTFDKDKPGNISNIHPTDDLLVFTGKYRKPRKTTRAQKNYQEYLRCDCCETFGEWMGFA
ncbi:MAG: hypothetical protein JKY81_05650 [Colwellia sp.]|nr:hypothetical protein [Colwellia sp.]